MHIVTGNNKTVLSRNNAEMFLEKKAERDCQHRGNVTVFNPADNRSAKHTEDETRCVWMKQRGM